MNKPVFFTLGLLAVASAYANIFETNETQRANLKVAATWAEETAKAAARPVPLSPTPPLFVRRALVADKAAGTVTVLAEGCEIQRGTTVEFPIIGELSDRDYEGAFRTFAKPGDIAAALEWLGVPRGANVDSRKMQFWAKGERVTIDVVRVGDTNAVRRPIQSYLLDKAVGGTPTWDSFVYCGSPDDPQSTNGVRLADTVAPNSVLATYNEPQSVLDTPVISNQSEVYERFVLADGAPFEPFALYTIIFTPVRRPDGLTRVKDVRIDFSVKEGKVVGGLTAGAAKAELEIPKLFETFKKLTADGFDPHVTVSFGEDLTVLQASVLARLLDKSEREGDIRVAPPPAGAFYYKGFLPNDDWRSAKTRISQPWEAHIPTNGTPIRLVQTVEDWSDKNSLDPRLSTKEYSVSTPEEAEKTITAGDASLAPNLRLQVALLFADKDTPLSAIMPTARALLPTHPIMYVFDE
jgi:hypothetical protein